ncbi:MAG: NAD(P)H-hydrate dehydratase [Roseimicrobium sp.]
MVVTCGQMQDAEQAAIERGASEEALMEKAGAGIHEVVRQFAPSPGTAVLYLGKGHNAGDAMVLARHLLDAGWQLCARLAFDVAEFKELPAKHWQTIVDRVNVLPDPSSILQTRGDVLLVDGLMGLGASAAPVRGVMAELIREINTVRRARHATTLAIDLPSGLNPLTGSPGDACVEADLTATIGLAKSVLLADAATRHVGRLAIVPLPEITVAQSDLNVRVLTSNALLSALPSRSFDFHKGQAGRVGLIAGSRGFAGAAVLASTGALRAGAGLVTLYVKEDAYNAVATQARAEVMVKLVRDYREVFRDTMDALAIGPGLGLEHEDEILAVIARADVPTVLDADALNMLARRGFDCLKKNQAPRLLTPHPGEMARLAERYPEWARLSRSEQATDFATKFPHATLLLKGARTVIAAAARPLSFNTTGNPGMGTGGLGDVLTGVCAAFAGQGVALYDAACLGAWLSGRAAERAVIFGGHSTESLTAGDVADGFGNALADLKRLVL